VLEKWSSLEAGEDVILVVKGENTEIKRTKS
jgi:hypothetical protein